MHVEPDEVTKFANIHADAGGVGQRHFGHGVAAGGAGAAAHAFGADGMEREGVDRFRAERAAKELDGNGTTAALCATPEDAVGGAGDLKRGLAARAVEFFAAG